MHAGPTRTPLFLLCPGEPGALGEGHAAEAASALAASGAARGDSESLICHTEPKQPVLVRQARPPGRRSSTCF